jgi:hypothetical protein
MKKVLAVRLPLPFATHVRGLSRGVTTAIIMAGMTALAQPTQFFTQLNGFKEVPSVITNGTGNFQLQISAARNSISYQLTYSGLSSHTTQAHIHIGQREVNGGIIVYLCDNTGIAPSGTPACPDSGTVSGTLTAVDVNPPGNPEPTTTQGIPPQDFAGLLAAIEGGVAYANIHTTNSPSGEIRGQLEPSLKR